MRRESKLNLIGQFLLFLATVAWGSSFIILKTTIEEVPAFFVIGVRFLFSGLLFCLIFIKRIIKISKTTLIRGIILGLILATAYGTQTYGLIYTTPARNAFITGLYCVMTPFFVWLFCKIKPKSYNIIAGIMCVIGMALVAFNGKASGESASNILLGDGLTFVCAVFYAMQIVYLVKIQKDKDDSISLLAIELLTVGVLVFGFSMAIELPKEGISMFKLNIEQIWKIAYLTFICTIFAQAALIFGQKMVSSSSQAAIILSLEAVFGALFSVLLGYESLTVGLIIGFSIIFIAMLISELKIDIYGYVKKLFIRNSKGDK